MRTVASSASRVAILATVVGWTIIALVPPRRPAPLPATAPAHEFSAERAMMHVEAIAQRPRPIGSAEHQLARDYIRGELTKLGVEAQVQRGTAQFSPRWAKGNMLSGYVENVVARLRGSANTRPVMLAAHYDTLPKGPGAADDASGVAVLLETLRALRSTPLLKNDVIFLFTDGEERGLWGAALFMRDHAWRSAPGVVLNLDAGGTDGPPMIMRTSAGNEWMIRHVLAAVPHAVVNSLFIDFDRMFPGNSDTDTTVFQLGGLAGMESFFWGNGYRKHTSQDSIANLNRTSVQEQGRNTLALVRRFGSTDLNETRSGDAVCFNAGIAGLIAYPANWIWPLACTTVLALGIVTWLGWRRRVRGAWIAIPLGALAALQLVVAAKMPGASYTLTWPLLAGVAGFAILVTAPPLLRAGWRLFVTLICLGWVILPLVPTMAEIVRLLGSRQIGPFAPFLGCGFALILINLLPQFVLLWRRRSIPATRTVNIAIASDN